MEVRFKVVLKPQYFCISCIKKNYRPFTTPIVVLIRSRVVLFCSGFLPSLPILTDFPEAIIGSCCCQSICDEGVGGRVETHCLCLWTQAAQLGIEVCHNRRQLPMVAHQEEKEPRELAWDLRRGGSGLLCEILIQSS